MIMHQEFGYRTILKIFYCYFKIFYREMFKKKQRETYNNRIIIEHFFYFEQACNVYTKISFI
jgi:hypothetical protein